MSAKEVSYLRVIIHNAVLSSIQDSAEHRSAAKSQITVVRVKAKIKSLI